MSDVAKDAATWDLIHAERATTAGILAGLTPEQAAAPSLCAGWTVTMTAGHIVQAAEQTTGSFMKGMAKHGFRFNTMMDREAHRLGSRPMSELAERLQTRTTTTNRPPAPALAMLGEVVTHTDDICRPLGLSHHVQPGSLVACMEMYKAATFPVGAKKRIAGLSVRATDVDWFYGQGPEVSGPAMTLIMAMTGRSAGLSDLSGPGLALLRSRMV